MGLINIFDTVSNESRTIKANGRLKNIITDVDFSHSLVLKAGNRLDGNYEVQPEDVLYIRKVPASTAVVAGIAIAIAVVGIGVSVGSAIYANKKSEEAKAQMEKAQRNANDLANAVQQLPFIRGAKNKSALGETVQFIMGSVYNTPYNVTDGFYTIDGTDGVNSYYNAVFSAGYGNQKITQLLLGNENIKADVNGISGLNNFDSTSLYYDQNHSNVVEVRQPGDSITLTEGNQKVSATFAASELKHEYGQDAVPVIVQAAENAMKIQVCIMFSSLRQYDPESETWGNRTATVRPYWSNDGGATWNEFSFDGVTNNTFVKNSNKNIRYVATKTFTASESYGKSISIKVVKETPKAESNTQEDCQLLWYQTFQYDALKSTSSSLVACTPLEPQLFNKVTRIAYRVIANDTTQNVLEELHAMAEGYAPVWDGEAWSQTKTTTRNPASWLLEVLTSDIHAPSKFNTSELYLPSFGQLYEYCETNRFKCDGIITAGETKRDIITKILSLCNATLVRNQEGLLEVFIDKEETNPVALLNTENIVSFSASKSLQRKTDGSKVTYINRNSWSVDTFYSMMDGGSYDYTSDTVDTLALDYVTEYEHAYKMAQRKHRQQILQPREIKADVGSEGDWYPLYSTILVQLPHLLQGLASSVIKDIKYNLAGNITQITISDAVNFVSGSNYGVVIQATNSSGYKLYASAVEGVFPEGETEGITRTLVFTTPLAVSTFTIAPEIGNHLSFGLLDSNGQFTKITNTFKIYGIEPGNNGGYTLTLRDYNADVYSYGTIPAYKSNITRPQTPTRAVSIEDVSRLRNELNLAQGDLNSLAKTTSSLYSNHIVTLYKASTLPLDSTGITGTLTYNFATNGISWNGDNNGWTIVKPVTSDPVYVTSATAYGRAATDNILPNEWAAPIPMGLNGDNGINTCTVNLYKRLSEAPTVYPGTLTYNFASGSLSGEKNGWQTSIPDVDEANNAPCWEIHATAMSTTSTDTIAASEWTSPAKITQDGYSKDEIISWIEDVQIESPNIYVTPSTGIFAVDDDGIIILEQSVNIEVKVIQTNQELDFAFGAIHVPDGFSITANNHVLTLTAQEGTKVRNCYFDIPIVFRQYSDNYFYEDTNGDEYVRLNCQDGQWYGEISSTSNLPSQVNNNYFLWTGTDTTTSEEVVEGGVFKQNTYYYSNGTLFKEATYIPYGMSIQATSETTFDSVFGITTVYGGKYYQGIDEVANIPATPIAGDFFSWTGTDQTSASIVQGGKLLAGCVYKWNGLEWIKDNSSKHRAMAMKELMSVAEDKLALNNSDVIDYIYELITMNVVTQNIQVTGEALINSAITAQLTLGKSDDQTGWFRSWNYGQNTGFSLGTDGKLVANEATIRGAITATSLTLGDGVTIPISKIDGINNYATKAETSKVAKGTSRTVNGITYTTYTVTPAIGTAYTYEVAETSDDTEHGFLSVANKIGSGSTSETSDPFFTVSKEGLLQANNAWIRGTIYATSGEFTGAVTANSFTLGANATITKGQNDSEHSYFGLASDGTLTVRKLNAIDGYFEGEVISGDFSWSQLRGYKLYRDRSGVGRAHIPVIDTWQIQNYDYENPVLFPNAGIATTLHQNIYVLRYRANWFSVFSKAKVLPDNTSSHVSYYIRVDGKIDNKNVSYMLLNLSYDEETHSYTKAEVHAIGYNNGNYEHNVYNGNWGSLLDDLPSFDIIF